MTTGIISLLLLVLVSIVMYFVMKIYSILRAVECSFHPVHDIEMEATKRTEVYGGVMFLWNAHDERNKEVSEFKFEKKREEKTLYYTVLSSNNETFTAGTGINLNPSKTLLSCDL